jgi:hypothetical protein
VKAHDSLNVSAKSAYGPGAARSGYHSGQTKVNDFLMGRARVSPHCGLERPGWIAEVDVNVVEVVLRVLEDERAILFSDFAAEFGGNARP